MAFPKGVIVPGLLLRRAALLTEFDFPRARRSSGEKAKNK
jgi:hypothetical protein